MLSYRSHLGNSASLTPNDSGISSSRLRGRKSPRQPSSSATRRSARSNRSSTPPTFDMRSTSTRAVRCRAQPGSAITPTTRLAFRWSTCLGTPSESGAPAVFDRRDPHWPTDRARRAGGRASARSKPAGPFPPRVELLHSWPANPGTGRSRNPADTSAAGADHHPSQPD